MKIIISSLSDCSSPCLVLTKSPQISVQNKLLACSLEVIIEMTSSFLKNRDFCFGGKFKLVKNFELCLMLIQLPQLLPKCNSQRILQQLPFQCVPNCNVWYKAYCNFAQFKTNDMRLISHDITNQRASDYQRSIYKNVCIFYGHDHLLPLSMHNS